MEWWKIVAVWISIAAILITTVDNEPAPTDSPIPVQQTGPPPIQMNPTGVGPSPMPMQQSVPSGIQMAAPGAASLVGQMGQLAMGQQPAVGAMGQFAGQPAIQQPQAFLNYSNAANAYGAGVDPMKQYVATGPVGLDTEVELSIRVANLLKPNVLADFDPLCVTYIRQLGNTEWVEVHRTEAVHNDTHPEFTKKPMISYSFGEKQSIMFKIINNSAVKVPGAAKGPKMKDDTAATAAAGGASKAAKTTTQEKDDSLGYAEVNLGELIAKGQMRIKLRQKSTMGQETTTKAEISIAAEKLIGTNEEVKMVFSGILHRPADVFIEIHKTSEMTDKTEIPVKTEVKYSH